MNQIKSFINKKKVRRGKTPLCTADHCRVKSVAEFVGLCPFVQLVGDVQINWSRVLSFGNLFQNQRVTLNQSTPNHTVRKWDKRNQTELSGHLAEAGLYVNYREKKPHYHSNFMSKRSPVKWIKVQTTRCWNWLFQAKGEDHLKNLGNLIFFQRLNLWVRKDVFFYNFFFFALKSILIVIGIFTHSTVQTHKHYKA